MHFCVYDQGGIRDGVPTSKWIQTAVRFLLTYKSILQVLCVFDARCVFDAANFMGRDEDGF